MVNKKKKENPFDAFNCVEVFLRLKGHLPKGKDGLTKQDYKDYCDMVMYRKKCPRGRLYKVDGLWEFAWEKYKNCDK